MPTFSGDRLADQVAGAHLSAVVVVGVWFGTVQVAVAAVLLLLAVCGAIDKQLIRGFPIACSPSNGAARASWLSGTSLDRRSLSRGAQPPNDGSPCTEMAIDSTYKQPALVFSMTVTVAFTHC